MTLAKKDLAHELTDKELENLEKRIAEVYKQAAKEMQGTIDEYFDKFKDRDKKMLERLANGEISEDYYKQWRLAQIGRGKRFEKMRDEYAERITRANEVATAYINDTTPSIYSLNRNYSAYTIEQVAGNVGFTLYDEQTVKRLIKDQPDLMPYYPKAKAIKRAIDLEYGKKKITDNVTSSILQGKSIPKMAKSLQKDIPEMSRKSAIRTARTATTGAQNAGRQDSLHAAKEMGINVKKRWLATLDGRTRHEHAMLDGQSVEEDEPFKVGGQEIMFPGDPSADPALVYNCRCTTVADLDGIDTKGAQRRAVDPDTGESVLVDSNMTYAQWAGWKDEVAKAVAKDPDTSRLSDFDKFRFAGLHARRRSNKYYEMDRVADDRVVVKVAGAHIVPTRYGYAFQIDATHVVFVKEWQVSKNEWYDTAEVLLTEKYFNVKEWGDNLRFTVSDDKSVYTYDYWKAIAISQQEEGMKAEWKVDGATRMLESFKKQAERRKKK